jgi:hypothetical protein
MAVKTPLWKRSFACETLDFEYNWTDWGCKFMRIKQTESLRLVDIIRTKMPPPSCHAQQKTSVFAVYDVDLDAAGTD